MKKILLLLTVFAACFCFAEVPISVEISEANGAVNAKWSPIQLGIAPHDYTQIFTEKTDVYGLSIGLLGLKQNSSILSFSPVCLIGKNYFLQTGILAGTDVNYALEIAPVLNAAELNYGIQAGVVNLENSCDKKYKGQKKAAPGLQLGLVNVGGCIQIGFLNFNPKGFIPCFPIINFSVK